MKMNKTIMDWKWKKKLGWEKKNLVQIPLPSFFPQFYFYN